MTMKSNHQQSVNAFCCSAPLLAKKKKLTNKDWMEKLTSEEYYVCREGGTEPPFTGKFVHNEEAGNYVCKCCKSELFSSDTKFESGTGWPSFYDAVYGKWINRSCDSFVGVFGELVFVQDSLGIVQLSVHSVQ